MLPSLVPSAAYRGFARVVTVRVSGPCSGRDVRCPGSWLAGLSLRRVFTGTQFKCT